MAAVRHLDLFETHLVVFIPLQNLVAINAVVSIFGAFGLKTLIHAPKLFFLDLTPLMGCNINESPKGTLCVSRRYLSRQT